MLRPSPPPSYHELPKRRRTCGLLGWNRWETITNHLETFDRCMLASMASLLFIFGFIIYILIAISPLLIFLVLRHYSSTLQLAVLPTPINTSLLLTPHSYSNRIGYFTPNDTYILAEFNIPIQFQFPSPNAENADVKTIQVQLHSESGYMMGGGQRSPSSNIEVPWIERNNDLLTAAIPVQMIIRERDGGLACLRGEDISMTASVSVHLVADSWLTTKSGLLHFNQCISLCCECIFPRREKTSTVRPRKHSAISSPFV